MPKLTAVTPGYYFLLSLKYLMPPGQKIRKKVLFSTPALEQAFVFPNLSLADILKSFYREKCDHVLTSPLLDTRIFFKSKKYSLITEKILYALLI